MVCVCVNHESARNVNKIVAAAFKYAARTMNFMGFGQVGQGKKRSRRRSLSIYAWAFIFLLFFLHFWQPYLRLVAFFRIHTFKAVAGGSAWISLHSNTSTSTSSQSKMKRFSFWLIDFKRISLSICAQYMEYDGRVQRAHMCALNLFQVQYEIFWFLPHCFWLGNLSSWL